VIQCFNPSCRSVSAAPASHCQVCQTPLPYRFLLAVGQSPLQVHSGALVGSRFLVWNEKIWLDTRPDTPLPPLDQLPDLVLAYQKLLHLAQHIPRPYAYLTPEQTGQSSPVLLLDMAPIATRIRTQDGSPGRGGRIEVALLSSLAAAWASGSGLQQLNWLRQVSALWPALADQQVASTLLDLDNLRVDGSLLRLTVLGSTSRPTLADLGQCWATLVATAQPPVAAYLGWLVETLRQGQLTTATALTMELEGAIQTLAQGLRVTVDWAADTDQGPTRDRNEDACYPEKEGHQQRFTGAAEARAVQGQPPPLLLVCDGIGGHEQGNVASHTAIQLLQRELEPLTQQPHQPPRVIAQRLKQALILANNAIADRNNDEHRSARARMGTTVVVALVHFPYVSLAHLGDSRAYRISPHTCYQITVDDDVASREAQMGYALYSEAVQSPNGGALIQALGINNSDYLYPSVQHLLIDDAAVLLLCSDGLSDYDRVEALAPSLVAPLVPSPAGDSAPLAATVTALIQEANRLNGHDNVTVGLMRFTPQPAPLLPLPSCSLRSALDDPLELETTAPGATTQLVTPGAATTTPSPRRSGSWPWAPVLVGAAVGLAALGGAVLALGQRPQPLALQPLAPRLPTAELTGKSFVGGALAATAEVPVGSFWQVTGGGEVPLSLLPQPATAPTSPVTLATGSLLRVVNRQGRPDNTNWVRLQVCSIPAGNSLAQVPQESDGVTRPPAAIADLEQRLSAPGDQGWVQTRQLYSAATFLELVTPTQAGRCLP
jgi:serine/threonine protein phosphatase PrpC